MANDATSVSSGHQILAYFSHSYRAADREVNLFFWRLFHGAGFFFTVDPQSQVFSIPYLESMLSLSNCFVAVIPRRDGTPGGCSPYIRFEYGLAVQAKKPWTIFVEQGIPGANFPKDAERVVPFNRQRLAAGADRFTEAIDRLGGEVRGFRNPDVKLQNPCGLLVGPGGRGVYTPEVIAMLSAALEPYGRTLEVVDVDFDTSFAFCLDLDRFDLLILEVREPLQAPWLAGYVMGRVSPSIKVCHLGPGETPAQVPLPALVAAHRPQHTTEAPAFYWRDPADLVSQVTRHIAKFNTERIEFHTLDDGLAYFTRAGRRREQVFVSNAGGANPVAQRLIAQLRRESVDFFHYQVKDALPVGERWLVELEREIAESGIFVALLTEQFLRSPWCLFELQVAVRRAAEGRLRIHPYVLEDGVLPALPAHGIGPLQARLAIGDDPADVIAKVVADIDRELQKPAGPSPVIAVPEVAPAGASADRLAAGGDLGEADRRRLVEILTARLTAAEAASRSGLVRAILMHAELYTALAGEDYTGRAEDIAITLVTACERLGALPRRGRAIGRLVAALHDKDLVSHDAKPFLAELVERLAAG
jgi:hypothetical protein